MLIACCRNTSQHYTTLLFPSASGTQIVYELGEDSQQLLKLNVLNVGMLVTIHGLAMRIIWMSLKAKLHTSTLSVAMKTGGNGRFLRECLPLRLQFSCRLRQFRGVTTGQAGFRAQGCIFQFD